MPAPLNPIVRRACYRWRHLLCALVRRAIVAPSIVAGTLLIVPSVSAQTLTTDQAVARAKQQMPGKLVAVSKEQQGSQDVYRVRILGSDGVVRTVFVNSNK